MSCENNPVPKMHIGKAIARKWVSNYQNRKRPLLKDTAPPEGDTKAVWYSIDSWRELMDEAACQGATGIRLYFAAYSQDPTEDGEGARIPRGANQMMTVVFVFTKMNEAGKPQDFFIEDDIKFNSRPPRSGDTGEGDFDTGNPCPPGDCDGSLLP